MARLSHWVGLKVAIALAVAAFIAVFVVSAEAQTPPGSPIINVATASFNQPGTTATFIGQSQPVTAYVQSVVPPTIRYWTDNNYTTPALVTRLGSNLFVQADAASCNRDPTVAEVTTITITSSLTGDSESFTATEWGINTGQFRIEPFVQTRDGATNPIVSGNGILEIRKDDVLTAVIEGCGGTGVATTQILIDPFGVVFDSRTNVPIAGATVTLIDVTGAGNGGLPGQPAIVFDVDGVTPIAPTQVTGVNGQFQFPLVIPSTYQLLILAPGSFTYPSTLPIGSLPAGRVIDPIASYGGNFVVSAATGAVRVDVPMDLQPVILFFVEKTANKTEAQIGDWVTYSVVVQNNSTFDASGVTMTDTLPAGFRYETGTLRLNGVVIPDPVGSPGPQLTFGIGTVTASGTATMTYRAVIGPGAMQGNGKNQIRATSTVPSMTSNVGQATVLVRAGVFTDKAILLGKVFVDSNRNDVQDNGEVGIPGVRIYLEDGTYIVTDSEGKYSFYGLNPKTHVLKLDSTTLPSGFKAGVLTARHNRSGMTCLADLKRGELRKINFADQSGSEKVLEEVQRRRAQAERELAEVQKSYKKELTADGKVPAIADVKALPSEGVIGGNIGSTTPHHTLPALNKNNSSLPSPPVAPVQRTPLENTEENNELDFVGLRDRDTLPMAQTNVRVKGVAGAKLSLKINGALVSDKRVGKRVEIKDKQFQSVEYIGIELKPGENTLELIQSDTFGNERGRKQITVVAPGKLGKIRLVLPPDHVPADSITRVSVVVEVTDDKGIPVSARTPITLETSLGEWGVSDLNPMEPGVQRFIEDGRAAFELIAPESPGDAHIVVSSGVLEAKGIVSFVPELRELLAVGVVETRVNFRNLNIGALSPARRDDGFEEELRNWTFLADKGHLRGGGRVALFLKGKVKGEYLLTLAFDSDKDTKERLFRDIQPDEFYPVYGDSVMRGYDAQSTGRLYVRVDKGKCYLLYGDFTTTPENEATGLGRYSRSVTGLKEHFENKYVNVNGWVTRDTSRQVIQEFRGDGTSGPFFFTQMAGLENSEKVEILVRDRNQPAVILRTTPMTRFADYTFEPFSGRLLFRAPIPSLDENLNPISIRVTFEVDQGGRPFMSYGADGYVTVTQRFQVGGATAIDNNPVNNYQLHSLNASLKLAEKTFVVAEVARSQSDAKGIGEGGRVELRHEGRLTQLRAYYASVGLAYDNPASSVASGRNEAGLKVTQKIGAQTRLVTEGIVTQDKNTGGDRKGITASVAHTFPNKMSAEIGGRYSTETAAPASATSIGVGSNTVRSVRAKVATPIPFVPNANIYGEFENDVANTDRRVIAVGGDYHTANRSRIYARHEFISSLGGPFELNGRQEQNTTVVGADSAYMKDGRMFNEYRMRDGISGREAEAAIGLRNDWNWFQDVRISTTFERVTPVIGGNKANEALAATAGLEYTRNPDWKGTARFEYRDSQADDRYFNTLGYARKINQDWTGLARSIVVFTDSQTAGRGDLFQGRLQAGAAYRQTREDLWNALFMYEYKFEDDETNPASPLERSVHIWSTHFNRQITPPFVVSGRYSGKFAFESDSAGDFTSSAHLVSTRWSYDLTKRWNVALNLSAFMDGNTGAVQYGAGPEVGYLTRDNLWIGIGYNLLGFHDRDLTQDGYSDHGVFFGMRLQFDEHLFDFGSRRKP